MNLVPWKKGKLQEKREMAPIAQFHSEMDRMIDRFFRDPWGNFGAAGNFPELFRGTAMADWNPSIDVKENAEEIIVRAEVPGVDAKDLNLTVHENVLTISGEKKDSRELKEGDLQRTESSYGSFARSIALPPEAKQDAIKAEHKNGVLTVHVPKQPGSGPKRIDVKGS
ncbi:MAG: Hsp20/alpha crystallin family protein [Planctomycetes bacterium]|nr:Hsp20/alpha crystallin family protein [Planctomycetota bacterium]